MSRTKNKFQITLDNEVKLEYNDIKVEVNQPNKTKGVFHMGNHEITSKIREYKEYSAIIKELEAVKDTIADELKAILTQAGEDTMTVGDYKMSYTDYSRRDIDKKALAADHSALYAKYLKESTYKRFIVA